MTYIIIDLRTLRATLRMSLTISFSLFSFPFSPFRFIGEPDIAGMLEGVP
jgi:hypothetical protein